MTKIEAWTPASVPVPEDGYYLVSNGPFADVGGELSLAGTREKVFNYIAGEVPGGNGGWKSWIGPLPETIAPSEPDDEPLADPFEVRVQIAAFSAEEAAEAVAKITDAIGSLVHRVSDGEVHRAVTRGLDVALELADLAKRDLGTLRDVLHEVE